MMRTSRAIATADPECLHLSVVLRGRINAAQEGRTGVARSGDVISYETSHPVIFRADQPYESLVVRVPKHLLGRDEAQITGLTAVEISVVAGLSQKAVAFFRSLVVGMEARSRDAERSRAHAQRAVSSRVRLLLQEYVFSGFSLERRRTKDCAVKAVCAPRL